MDIRCLTVEWAEMLVLCGYADGRLRLWDMQSSSCLRTYEGHAGPIRGIVADWERAFAAECAEAENESIALSCGNDGCMRLWGVTSGRCLRTMECARGQVLAVSVDWCSGQAIAAYQNGHLGVWDISDDEGGCLQ